MIPVMKMHSLNCTSFCPGLGRIFSSQLPKELVCHVLLLESNKGLVLVDTGLSRGSLEDASQIPFSERFLFGLGGTPEMSAIEQVRGLGFQPEDVTHIIPTHLDNDHCDGIVDFPNAEVHTSEAELRAAREKSHWKEKSRYRMFKEHDHWNIHFWGAGEKWFGFDSVQPVPGLEDQVLLISLPGHTSGHFGVAVNTSDGWVLHCGDSYYDQQEFTTGVPLGTRMFLRISHMDFQKAMQNRDRLKSLRESHPEVKTICAHDKSEFPCC